MVEKTENKILIIKKNGPISNGYIIKKYIIIIL